MFILLSLLLLLLHFSNIFVIIFAYFIKKIKWQIKKELSILTFQFTVLDFLLNHSL